MSLVKFSVFLCCVVSYIYLLHSILFSVWLQLHRFVLNVKVSQYHTCTFLMKSCCRYFLFCHTKTWHLALEYAVSSIVYPWMKPCVSFCYKSFINLQWRTKVLTHFRKMAPFCIVDILIPFPCLPQPLPPKINVEFWTLKSSFYFRQHWFGGWGDLRHLKRMK